MQIDILMCKLCYPWCIKHQRDISALSAVYQVYRTGGAFEVWLKYEISVDIITGEQMLMSKIHEQSLSQSAVVIETIKSQNNSIQPA